MSKIGAAQKERILKKFQQLSNQEKIAINKMAKKIIRTRKLKNR